MEGAALKVLVAFRNKATILPALRVYVGFRTPCLIVVKVRCLQVGYHWLLILFGSSSLISVKKLRTGTAIIKSLIGPAHENIILELLITSMMILNYP